MATNQTQRPQYFEDQYLGAADLTAAVEYARLQQARHALGAHTWGIAAGLQLTEKASAAGGGQVDVFIQPGFAWDGFGRPIIVLAPYKLTGEKFKSLVYDATIDAGNPEGRLVEVWLRYVETPTRAPASGFEVCSPSGNFSRVDELFQVEVGEKKFPAEQRDPLSVGGRTLDAADVPHHFDALVGTLYDASVPYQSFPEDDARARWLIPVGLVRWKPEEGGQPGKFVARNAEDLKASRSKRHYAGVVGESVAAPDGHVRLRDRSKNYSAYQSDDLVWVEGSLRVEGDANLFGGALKLLDKAGQDNKKPLTVSRFDKNQDSSSLRVQIGAGNQGHNRFEVGPAVSNTFTPHLTVLDSGRVGIGTTEPNYRLTLQGTAGTYLNVKANSGAHEVLLGADSAGGIVSTMTNHDLQLRAGGNETKVTIKTDGRVGIGTTSPNRLLTLRGEAGTYLNVQSDAGAHEVLLGADWNGGIVSTMTNHDLQLRAGGNDTKVTIKADGDVGIGTPNPADRLDVQGSLRVLSGSNPIRFTSVWTAFPDNVTNHAEICNDTTYHRTLMIVGNKSAGQGRKVSIWDRLDVNGHLKTDVLQLGGKWRLSGVGDVFGNDDWLRLMDVSNVTYYGGFAANKLWSWTGTLEGSDERLKEGVATLEGAADGLLALRGVRFNWRADAGPHKAERFGLIAQEVEAVFPELVETGPGGMKGINYSGLIAPLVEAFKAQQREINALREEVDGLRLRRGDS